MRRLLRGAALVLAALMIIAGIWYGTRSMLSDAPRQTSSAAMGLVLEEDAGGLYVLAVSSDSAAEAAGIAPGDYLLRLGDAALSTAMQLDELLSMPDGPRMLTLKHGGQEMTLELP